MKNISIIGIVASNRQQCAPAVNDVLSQYGNIVLGRMGLPLHSKKCWVITVVVNAPTTKISALIRDLKTIKGVSIKSTLA
ncbi:MAG: TM1266 family iron-only hydrogenase system putative regulator [Verrucomicrobiota bacterium]